MLNPIPCDNSGSTKGHNNSSRFSPTTSLLRHFFVSNSVSNFIELSNELESPGTSQLENKEYTFNFPQVNMKYESYKGDYAVVKYIIRVTIETKLRSLKYENEFCVINPIEKKILDYKIEPIQLGVGIKDLLQLSIEFRNKNIPHNGCMFGKITFKKVQIGLKFMEIQIVRREILLGDINCEPAYLAKFEIMDGGPIKNEFIPVRMFLKPYELTPTYENVNSKFYVRYYINLVIADQNDERYFKQKEIVLYRVKKDKGMREKEKKKLFTGEEYVVMDKAGRVQIPRELLDEMHLQGNKLKLEMQDGKIIITAPEAEEAAAQ